MREMLSQTAKRPLVSCQASSPVSRMKRETLSNIPWLLGRWSGCACARWQIGGEMICMRMSQTTMYNKIRPPTPAKDSNASHGQATATAASHSRPRSLSF
jgi:hypothetical protein